MLMGNPFDLEILSGLDQMDDGMYGDDPSAFNMLAGYGGEPDPQALMGALMGAGYDPYTAAAIMGLNLNPLSWVKKGAQGLTRGLYNVTRGKAPWARVAAPAAAAGALLAARAAQSPMAAPQPLNALVSAVPGASARGGKVQPLGFTNGVFNATSGTTITVRARPQRPLRGGRLVGSFARQGASATGLLTLVSLFVGTDGQLLSGDPISFDALAPNAFGVGVNLTPAAVGQEIVATVAISGAPTMTDSVTFNLTMFGMSIG